MGCIRYLRTAMLLLATSMPGAEASVKLRPIVINIDNPKFRKMVAAIPDFKIHPTDKNMQPLSGKLADRLRQFLEFSGYFKILRGGGPGQSRGGRVASMIAGFEGAAIGYWRAIGVESLTVGNLAKEGGGGYRLEIRTADVQGGRRVLGQAYTLGHPGEAEAALKHYADQLLMAYTSRPGIFNSRIVFVGRKRADSQKQIYLCDVDGTGVIQLTSSDALHLSPSFSPEGDRILFTSYESGNPDLYMKHLVTGKIEKIAGDKGINSGGAFSDNGKLIAFSGSIRGNTEIYLWDFTGRKRKPFLTGHGIDVNPAFSPDGRWLAFVSGRYGNPHIFKASLKWEHNRTRVRVTGDVRLTYAGWYNAAPAWSPDSRKIAFAGFDRDIGRFDIFLMDQDGKHMERLTLNAGDNESPSWSPNGQLLVFSSNRIASKGVRKGPAQLFIMNRDGSSQRLLDTGLYSAETPRWGPFIRKGLSAGRLCHPSGCARGR